MSRVWVILLLVDLGLAWGLGALWLDEDLDPKNVSWRPPAAVVPVADSLAVYQVALLQRDISQLVSTAERPLFWATRRPPPPAPPERPADAEPDPFADVHLFGLIGHGEEGIAILRSNGKLRRVKFGGLVGPWSLQGVEGNSAQFKAASGEVRVLTLVHAKQGASAPGGTSEASPVTGGAAKFDDVIARRKAARAAAIAAAKQRGTK